MAQKQEVVAHFQDYYAKERRKAKEEDGEAGMDDEEEEEEEDEDDFDDILDVEDHFAMQEGAPVANVKSLSQKDRYMRWLNGPAPSRGGYKHQLIEVKGRFLFDGPWWMLTFDAQRQGKSLSFHCAARGNKCRQPSYALRRLDGKEGKELLESLLSIALDYPVEGDANHQIQQSFWDHFERSQGPSKSYTLHRFFETLEAAVSSDDLGGVKLVAEQGLPLNQAAKIIMARFHPEMGYLHRRDDKDKEEKTAKEGPDLRPIYRCYRFPELFRVLPRLIQRKAFSILTTPSLKRLEKLNDVLENSPEDFGFETSMRKHGWLSLEASLQGFIDAGLVFDLSLTLQRALNIYDILKAKCLKEGHTWVTHYAMKNRYDTDPDALFGKFPKGNDLTETLEELELRGVLEVEDNYKYHWVKYRTYERNISDDLKKLQRRQELNPLIMEAEEDEDCQFDEYQRAGALNIMSNAVSVILGRGGCGKTHVVCNVVRQYPQIWQPKVKQRDEGDDEAKEFDEIEKASPSPNLKKKPIVHSRVLLAAPTGRAASILRRRTEMTSKTLHSILYSAYNSAKARDDGKDGRSPENYVYSKVEILVVDECSMVPIQVLSGVLSNLLKYRLRKLILLGDEHQLPSIQPGNFLVDVISGLKDTTCITRLQINHRTDAGGKLIVENAKGIAEKQAYPKFERDRFELISLHDVKEKDALNAKIQEMVKTREQLKDHRKSQIVAFTNHHVKHINNICCQHYAGHKAVAGRKLNFQPGDKICSKKNTDIKTVEETLEEVADASVAPVDETEEMKPAEKYSPPERINNGDIFFIKFWHSTTEDRKTKDMVTLQSMDEEEGNTFTLDFSQMRGKAKAQHAWARTIHTFQGSETDYVVYVLSNTGYETWQHLYTAVTRGCRGCFIVGSEAILRTVLTKHPHRRNSSLAEFIKDRLGLNKPTQRVLQPSPLATTKTKMASASRQQLNKGPGITSSQNLSQSCDGVHESSAAAPKSSRASLSDRFSGHGPSSSGQAHAGGDGDSDREDRAADGTNDLSMIQEEDEVDFGFKPLLQQSASSSTEETRHPIGMETESRFTALKPKRDGSAMMDLENFAWNDDEGVDDGSGMSNAVLRDLMQVTNGIGKFQVLSPSRPKMKKYGHLDKPPEA